MCCVSDNASTTTTQLATDLGRFGLVPGPLHIWPEFCWLSSLLCFWKAEMWNLIKMFCWRLRARLGYVWLFNFDSRPVFFFFFLPFFLFSFFFSCWLASSTSVWKFTQNLCFVYCKFNIVIFEASIKYINITLLITKRRQYFNWRHCLSSGPKFYG